MTHRWGFDLSMTAVRLMRREAGHWHEVAQESLDGGDMDQRLRALVDQVPEPRVVDIFLPRDQILYTDVKLTDPDNALTEIEAEMAGRTPYALSELEIDWEIGAENTARVAVIARQTLHEAEAFADQCGLSVSRFSSLPDAEDFPRQPDFGIGSAGDDALPEDQGSIEEPAAFASTRTDAGIPKAPDIPPRDAASGTAATDESTPVVRVDDSAPVMRVLTEREAPLDPGPPLPRDDAVPRIRTDLSLPDGGGRAAASLTPPAPADPYARSERAPAERMRILGIGLAAVLTAGIGLIVWSILPANVDTGDSAAIPPAATDVATVPGLSDVPPDALVDLAIVSPTAPSPDITPGNAPLVEAAVSRVAGISELGIPVVQPGNLPALPGEPGTPPEAVVLSGEVLAALPQGAETSGIDFDTPQPPVTRPGNVALPGVQSFASGIIPSVDDAPEYVPPSAPVIASSEPEDSPSGETLSLADETASEDTAPQTPETDTAAAAPAPDDAPLPPEISLDQAALDGTAASEAEIVTTLDSDSDSIARPSASDAVADAESTLPAPTELAASLEPSRAPPRPASITQAVAAAETQLARIRPEPRPASAQIVAEEERGSAPPSQLAVTATLSPRDRPDDMSALVARAEEFQRQQRIASVPSANTSAAVRAALQESEDAEATNPRNSPRLAIPSNASVARQATIEEAIRLNRLNLIGVYGLPSDRRALVRLSNGRYVKVKVGDQIDGGTIARITDEALQYRKGGRTYQLSIPQG